MLPNYLFEISWEVCNKVGGIYTVLSTKAATLSEIDGLNTIYVGPDLWAENDNPLFTEDKRLWKKWRNSIVDEKFKVRCGYWEIPGRPKVILVDFDAYFSEKESFYYMLWDNYKVDSLHAYGDYDDSVMFGYAVGCVIESFYKFHLTEKDNVVVNAPHTAVELAGEWSHPYSRMEAAFPLEWVKCAKFFPYVTKIDNGYGDRNLVCCNVD